eukprot:scaffold3735_cov367-Prasinococcus_capsulatus_cf.AAC.1
MEEYGKSRSWRTLRNSWPTAPLTPAIAMRGPSAVFFASTRTGPLRTVARVDAASCTRPWGYVGRAADEAAIEDGTRAVPRGIATISVILTQWDNLAYPVHTPAPCCNPFIPRHLQSTASLLWKPLATRPLRHRVDARARRRRRRACRDLSGWPGPA